MESSEVSKELTYNKNVKDNWMVFIGNWLEEK